MSNKCLHPIELGKMYDWIIDNKDPNTVIIIAKCGNCGMDCKITVTRKEKP